MEDSNMPIHHSYNIPPSDHIWHYPDEWALEQGLRRYGMHHNKYEIMMHDYDLGDLTTYEVEELQRKAVEVLRQMVSVGRSMEQMGGFIVAANCVDEYIHDCYYPRQMAEEYKVFAAEKEAYLATVLPLNVANGDTLPSPLPWKLPTSPPTLSEIQEYMQGERNIEDSESASEDELVSPSRPMAYRPSRPSIRLEQAHPSLSLPSFWRRYGNQKGDFYIYHSPQLGVNPTRPPMKVRATRVTI
ncbi:hypothetical protein MIR68_009031 [Amoeboaphelidium protococcarum]|nr:hypothetical protein MIR68_009031 [Amoeboaphelidium protococcarum]